MSKVLAEHKLPSGQTLRTVLGDLTLEEVDAIVNAANAQLAHGGGVAAAVVRRGGRVIQEESDAWVRERGPVPHAAPAVTSAGKLPSRYVIHAVGPRWGEGDEDSKLSAAVSGALEAAERHGLASLAMPAISTGIFGFPLKRGVQVILDAVLIHLNQNTESSLTEIRFTNIDQPTAQAVADEFARRWPDSAHTA